MTKIIAPKCSGPKKGFFDRGLVPCIACDHAPGGAVALRRVKRFCGLPLSICHADGELHNDVRNAFLKLQDLARHSSPRWSETPCTSAISSVFHATASSK